jgi:hypothetical protein
MVRPALRSDGILDKGSWSWSCDDDCVGDSGLAFFKCCMLVRALDNPVLAQPIEGLHVSDARVFNSDALQRCDVLAIVGGGRYCGGFGTAFLI